MIFTYLPLYTLDGEDEESTVLRFLTGKKLYLTGVESEKEIELVDWIGEAGGEVVSIEHKGSIGNVFSRIFFLEKKPHEI